MKRKKKKRRMLVDRAQASALEITREIMMWIIKDSGEGQMSETESSLLLSNILKALSPSFLQF